MSEVPLYLTMHSGDLTNRGRANVARTRQSRPGFGLGFQGKILEFFQAVPSSLGSASTRGGLGP